MDVHVTLIYLAFIAIITIFPGSTGLNCFSCDDVDHPYKCNVTKTCDVNQVCITAENVNDNFKLSYKLGCSYNEFCDYKINLFGKKKRHLRHECCSFNLCNKYDMTSTSEQRYTTPITTTHTPEPTVTEIVTSATKITHETTTVHICAGHYYFRFHNACYNLNINSGHWGLKDHDPCISNHMHLAVIPNHLEHHDVVQFIREKANYTGDVWLGGSYNHQIQWHWINRQQINETDSRWKNGAQHGNLCLLLVGVSWEGHACGERHATLCKRTTV